MGLLDKDVFGAENPERLSGKRRLVDKKIFNSVNFPFDAFEFTEYDKTTAPSLKMKTGWHFDLTSATLTVGDVEIALGDLFTDNKLTPTEKFQLKRAWDSLDAAHDVLLVSADNAGIEAGDVDYDACVDEHEDLEDYVTPLFVDLTATSDINGNTLRGHFSSYYTAAEGLQKAIELAAIVAYEARPTYTEIMEGFIAGGGTTALDAPTITTCKGVFRGIVLKWTRQLTLTNFDHYELQVSSDDSTWYSLELDGSDWKASADPATTDVEVEFFVHSNIPHGGTTTAPVGRTLYYRVRTVNKDDDVSDWSVSASATTTTIDSGDLAANSVWANNVNAGQIDTVHMVADSITANEIAANAVGTEQLIDGEVTTAKVEDLAISAGKIALNAVTYDKLAPGSRVSPTNGCVAYWACNEGSGTTLGDRSGNGYDGTLENFGPVAEYHFDGDCTDSSGNGNDGTFSGGTASYGTGVEGQAIHFDGVDDYVSLPSNVYSKIDVDLPFSVAFWLNLDTVSPADGYVRFLSVTGASGYIKIYWNNTLKRFAVNINDGTSHWLESSTIAASTWYHLVLRHDGSGEYELLVDNSLVDSDTLSLSSWSPTAGYIGGDGTGYSYDGLMDDARVYDYYISDAEIDALYSRPQLPSHWVDGISGKALAFDGVDACVNLPAELLSTIHPTGSFAISSWFKMDTITPTDSYNRVWHFNDGSGNFIGLYYNTPTGKMVVNVKSDGGTDSNYSFGTTTIVADTWYHVVFENDGSGNTALFCQGSLEDSDAHGTIVDFAPTNGYLGGSADGHSWDGLLDEIRIFNRALTAAEVKSLYENPAGPMEYVATDNILNTAVTAGKIATQAVNSKHLASGDVDWDTKYASIPSGAVHLPLYHPSAMWSDGTTPEEKFFVYHEPDWDGYTNPFAKTWLDGETDEYTSGCAGFYTEVANLIPSQDLTNSTYWPTRTYIEVPTEVTPFRSHPMYNLECSSSSSAYIRSAVLEDITTDGVLSLIVRKDGTSTTTLISLYDYTVGAYRIQVSITWATGTISVMDGTDAGCMMLDDNDTCAFIAVLSSGMVTSATNDNKIFIYPDTAEADGNKVSVGLLQFEQRSFVTPFTPTTRQATELVYENWTWPQKGAIECWVRPRFNYDIGTNRYIFGSYESDSNNRIYAYYSESDDKIKFVITVGGTSVSLESSAYNATTIDAWIHCKFVWNSTDDEWELFIDGSSVDSSTTSLGTLAFEPYLQVGGIPLYSESYEFDGEIVDFTFYDGDANVSTAHYNADVPFGDAAAIANANQSVIISPYGIQLNKAEISMYDKKGRFIDVGTQGLLARDASGNVIHDILTDTIGSGKDFEYGGHIYPFRYDTYFMWKDLSVYSSGIENIEISDYSENMLSYNKVILYFEHIWSRPTSYSAADSNNVLVYDCKEYNSSTNKHRIFRSGIDVRTDMYFLNPVINSIGLPLATIHNYNGTPYISLYIVNDNYNNDGELFIFVMGVLK